MTQNEKEKWDEVLRMLEDRGLLNLEPNTLIEILEQGLEIEKLRKVNQELLDELYVTQKRIGEVRAELHHMQELFVIRESANA